MTRQKGRTVGPLDVDSVQVVTAAPTQAAWDAAERLATLDARTVAAGAIQNRESGLWHTWISLYGTDLTSWYVGPDGLSARAFVQAIVYLFGQWRGDSADVESMNELMELAMEQSTAPGATLPDDQVNAIAREIARIGTKDQKHGR